MTSIAPDWPRMMRRAVAAAYCDLSVAAFEREVSAGRLPASVTLGDQPRWSRALLDEALERLTGETAPDWRRNSGLYGAAA